MANSAAVILQARSFLDDLGWQYDVRGDHFSVPYASTRFMIYSYHIGQYPNEVGMLVMKCILLNDVEDSTPLYRYVATHQPPFGNLEVIRDTDNSETDIWYAYSVVADTMIVSEFEFALSLFAGHADELDDELQSLFGGRRAID